MRLEQMAPSYSTLGELANYIRRNFPRISTSWNVEHLDTGEHKFVFKDAPFDTAGFFAPTGTWTVVAANVLKYQYVFLGGYTVINFVVQNTTTNGVGNELRIRIPGRIKAKHKEFTGWGWISVDAGGNNGALQIFTREGGTETSKYLGLFRTNLANWANSAGDVGVRGGIIFDGELY